jgi:ubiquinone/menaquinone biosynthesis C-methylase UbiE
MTALPQTVFGQRAAFYTTSSVHKDKAVLDRVVELAQPKPTDIVLDVATGTGHTAFAFALHVKSVIATDITPEMLVEGGRMKDEGGITNVEFQLGDAHDLPFEDATFDIVTCRRAAHHFVDITQALREMRRVLRPGGRLVIDDRSVPEDDFVDVTMNRLDVLHDRSHVREYRPSEWGYLLQEAGCTIVIIEPYTKHRPLSAFTEKADPDDVREIASVVTALNEDQRTAMNVVEKEGEIYLNHWFVMAVGVKSEA